MLSEKIPIFYFGYNVITFTVHFSFLFLLNITCKIMCCIIIKGSGSSMQNNCFGLDFTHSLNYFKNQKNGGYQAMRCGICVYVYVI